MMMRMDNLLATELKEGSRRSEILTDLLILEVGNDRHEYSGHGLLTLIRLSDVH